MTMFPGPVSNAITCSGVARGGITVMLAMPPMFSAIRVREGMAKEKIVHKGNQRRPLTAGGDVARAEVGNHRDARALRDHRRFAQLQRVPAALMVDRLPVAADQLHGAEAAR